MAWAGTDVPEIPDVTPPSTMDGPSNTPLAPPTSTTLTLPNANVTRFPESSVIDPYGDLVRSPGGVLLPPGVSLD